VLTILLTAALGLTEIDVLAREEAEERLDAAVTAYVLALRAGFDAPELRNRVSVLSIALHAVYERDRMRQIDLAIDLARVEPAEAPAIEEELSELELAREAYLRRRVATEREQRTAIAAAARGR
jgi:hypothetical protein